ncbi:MAG: Fpg/Nei family DNA glycosylase [Geminicoccaceae bacterium]
MPELPDVEIYRRYLDEHALRQRIAHVAVGDARILGDLSARAFVARLRGNRFEASRRHGKHLLVRLGHGGWLTLHFGMTGNLVYFRGGEDDPPYDRVRFDFAGGAHLAYVNRRMLGRVGLTDDADAFIRAEALGPDALDPGFDLAAFTAAVAGRRRDIKSVLMDQALLAGIGNIYADEILFQARLHPKAPMTSLDDRQRALLFEQIKAVLRTAIARGAGAEQFLERLPDDHLLPHRDKGGRCPRCGAALATLKAAGRTSYFCPRCQPEPG